MLYDCDVIIHVVCNHPDYSSRYYSFGVNSVEITNNRVRKIVEKKVNEHGFWHDVTIWSEHYIDGKMYRQDY